MRPSDAMIVLDLEDRLTYKGSHQPAGRCREPFDGLPAPSKLRPTSRLWLKIQKWVAIMMRNIFKVGGGLQWGLQTSHTPWRAGAIPGKSN